MKDKSGSADLRYTAERDMNGGFYTIVPSLQGGIQYDPDSSPLAWEHYRRVYKPEDWPEYDLNDIHFYELAPKNRRPFPDYWYINQPLTGVTSYHRLYSLEKGYASKEKNGSAYFKFSMRLSGETDFDFKEDGNKRKNKYGQLCVILRRDLEGDRLAYALSELGFCKDLHHSPVNFSLMQSVGNMQWVKSEGYGDYLDRPDSFVCLLDDYFARKSQIILSKATDLNRSNLIEYLASFSDIYDYCHRVYFLKDRAFVDRVISEGKLPVRTAEDVLRYLKLAKDFWSEKEKFWSSPLNGGA